MFDDYDYTNDFGTEEVQDKPQRVSNESYIRPADVPFIPHSVAPRDYMDVLPKGFDDVFTSYLDTDNSIVLKMTKPENENYSEVRIKPTLYSSEIEETLMPKFLFEMSSILKESLDYLGKDTKYVLTANQVLYLLIAHRANSFKGYNVQFTYLLQKDIKALSDYLEYDRGVSYNTQQKNKHTYVVIPASKHDKEFPYGDFFASGCNPNEDEWKAFLADVKDYILPSSDTAMHKRAKVVLSKESIYRSVGYHHDSTKGHFFNLFESKQNLSARLKTHLFGDAKELVNPDLSVIQQDCIVKKDPITGLLTLHPKDRTLKKAIVLFSPMHFESKRFVAGEAEVSSNIADTSLYNIENVNVSFTGKDYTKVEHEINKEVFVKRGEKVLLGYDKDLEPVYLQNVRSYTVLSISQSSTAGLSRLRYKSVEKAGNARCTSNTGLKFVTKVMSDLGTVYLPKPEEDLSIKAKFAPTVRQYLKDVDEDSMAKYKKIRTSELEDMLQLKPDVIVGMNAVKATTSEQSNSIAIAQACLAVELGYYVPKEKFGFKNLLNSLDAVEINEAKNSLPEFIYVNRFGQREKVLVGLAYINFTELGSVYSTFKPQSFAFTSGKNIDVNCPALSAHIYENYLDKDMLEIVNEFYKILNDKRARYRVEEKLPRYNPDTIRKKNKDGMMMFNAEQDLMLSPVALHNYSHSKLLDEEWNKGFYIDLTKYQNGMLIRIPCAKTLKRFVGSLQDGTYSFHSIVVNVCKLINNILGTPKYPKPNISFIYDKSRRVGDPIPTGKNRRRMTSYDQYMLSIQGGLYSNEDSAMMIIQSLIKPKINGLGMKQVVEPLLPADVIVITDDSKYNRLMKECYTKEEMELTQSTLLQAVNTDTDFLVDQVFDDLFDSDEMSTEEVERILNDVPFALAIRNPS